MNPIIKICDRHADLLNSAMTALQDHFPLSASSLENLSDVDIAIFDQYSTRLGKLQDTIGTKLFTAVLEATKEQGELKAFIDRLNRLEKLVLFTAQTIGCYYEKFIMRFLTITPMIWHCRLAI